MKINRKILVVEDNHINQRVVRLILEKKGYTIDVADDGFEAIEKASSIDYDLIFMDVRMPGMDGTEATAKIRKAEINTGNRIPIIALTGSVAESDKKLCTQSGMDDFVSKPIDKHELFAKLDDWLSHKSAV